MPTDSCHPIAAHQKLRLPDWYVSSLMLDRALDAILKRVTLDRKHDIPYLAGYSQNGDVIYIDRHLPRSFMIGGKSIATDRYLVLHEAVEKTLLDQLGLHYQHAHQIALRAEEAAVRADGVGWRGYDRAMQRYIKRIGDERLQRLPADLDQQPYRDEHDRDLLARMATATRRGKRPAGIPSRARLSSMAASLAATSGSKASAKTRARAKASDRADPSAKRRRPAARR